MFLNCADCRKMNRSIKKKRSQKPKPKNTCILCEAGFPSFSQLIKHMECHLLMPCTICNQKFFKLDVYQQHKATHYTTQSTQTELFDERDAVSKSSLTPLAFIDVRKYIKEDPKIVNQKVPTNKNANCFALIGDGPIIKSEILLSEEEEYIIEELDYYIDEPDNNSQHSDNEHKNILLLKSENPNLSDLELENNLPIKSNNKQSSEQVIHLQISYDEDDVADDDDSEYYKQDGKTYFDRPKPLHFSKPIHCAICDKSVNDILIENYDIIQCDGKSKISCKICCVLFTNDVEFKRHENDVHFAGKGDEIWISCTNCLVQTHESIKISNRKQTTVGAHICQLCLQSYNSELNLQKHTRVHYDRVVYYCKQCPKKIIGKHSFVQHNNIHTKTIRMRNRQPDGNYECSYCGYKFVFRHAIAAHVKKHIPSERFKCEYCPVTLKTASYLKQHLKGHFEGPAATCDLCGKSFNKRQNFLKHMRRHTGERPFVCQVCSKSFAFKEGLAGHNRIHTGEKPFACALCPKVYRDYTDLKRHKRSHGGYEKKFKCHLCDNKYYERKQLRYHLKTTHQFAAEEDSKLLLPQIV